MAKLTDTQGRALRAIAKGPLFRGRRGNWSRVGASPVSTATIDALLRAQLIAREHARNGSPYVRITHYGRSALGQTTEAEQAARRAAELHDRIAR